MKCSFCYGVVLFMMLQLLTGTYVYADSDQPSVAYTKPNPKILNAEKAQWMFLRNELLMHREQAQSWMNHFGNSVERWSGLCSDAIIVPITFGIALALSIVLKVINDPDEWAFNLWPLTGILSTFGYWCISYLIPAIGRLLSRHAAVAYSALNNFIDGWPDYRENCPVEIRPLFDTLLHDYYKDELLTISDEQALEVMQETLALAELAQVYHQILLEKKGLMDPLSSDAHAEAFDMMLQSLLALFRTSDGSKAQKSQWEYVANQLGILNASHQLGSIKKLLNDYKFPLSTTLGFPLGTIVGNYGVRLLLEVTDDVDGNVILGGQLFGGLVGAVLTYIVSNSGNDELTSWHKERLTQFIEQWNDHKAQCPQTMVPLFDQLFILYHRQGSLNLDEKFIEELYRMVAKAWLKISSTKDEL